MSARRQTITGNSLQIWTNDTVGACMAFGTENPKHLQMYFKRTTNLPSWFQGDSDFTFAWTRSSYARVAFNVRCRCSFVTIQLTFHQDIKIFWHDTAVFCASASVAISQLHKPASFTESTVHVPRGPASFSEASHAHGIDIQTSHTTQMVNLSWSA